MAKPSYKASGLGLLLVTVAAATMITSPDAAAQPRVPTLSGLRCADGEVARYDAADRGWVCSSALTDVIAEVAGLPTAQQLKAFDGDGVEIGPAVSVSAALLQVSGGPRDGTFYALSVNRSRLVGNQIFYTGAGCTGDAYVSAPQTTDVQGALEGAAVGPDPGNGGALSAFLLADPDSVAAPVAFMSRFGLNTTTLDYSCSANGITTDARPVGPVLDLEAFAPPFEFHD